MSLARLGALAHTQSSQTATVTLPVSHLKPFSGTVGSGFNKSNLLLR